MISTYRQYSAKGVYQNTPEAECLSSLSSLVSLSLVSLVRLVSLLSYLSYTLSLRVLVTRMGWVKMLQGRRVSELTNAD